MIYRSIIFNITVCIARVGCWFIVGEIIKTYRSSKMMIGNGQWLFLFFLSLESNLNDDIIQIDVADWLDSL